MDWMEGVKKEKKSRMAPNDFGLSNWKHGAGIYGEGGQLWEDQSWGDAEIKEFSLGHVKFEMPVTHPRGNVKWPKGYTSLEFRGEVRVTNIIVLCQFYGFFFITTLLR